MTDSEVVWLKAANALKACSKDSGRSGLGLQDLRSPHVSPFCILVRV